MSSTQTSIVPNPPSAIMPWSSIDPAENVSDDQPVFDYKPSGGGWTIAVLCLGLALMAAAMIIPQADANRRLAYEHQKLQNDLDQIRKQVLVNEEFLKKIETDPQLSERLARRQMRVVRQGEQLLDLSGNATADSLDSDSSAITQDAGRSSPFMIVKVPAPAALAPYRPVGGLLASWCRQPGTQVYVLGTGMLLAAAGLVLGESGRAVPVQDD